MYRDFWNDKHKFDKGDYPEQSPYFDIRNQKVIEKFKDEAGSIPINEFVGLRSKLFFMKDNEKGGKTAEKSKRMLQKRI